MKAQATHRTRTLVVAILSILPIGCASSGKRVDASKITMIVAGETTKAEILKLFGKPTHYFNRNASGKGETWHWGYAYANPLKGGSRALTISFDKNDVVTSHSYQNH